MHSLIRVGSSTSSNLKFPITSSPPAALLNFALGGDIINPKQDQSRRGLYPAMLLCRAERRHVQAKR